VWLQDQTIYPSRFGGIFTKVVNLTKLTLRGDADDNALRSIGAHCHFLQHLDIARSNSITNYGFFNLILKKRIGGKRHVPLPTAETILDMADGGLRPLATSLETFIVTDARIGLDNLLLMAQLLSSYLSAQVPDVTFRRVGSYRTPLVALASDLDWIGIPTEEKPLYTLLAPWISSDLWARLEPFFELTLTASNEECQLDVYRDQYEPGVFEVYSHRASEWLLRSIYRISRTLGFTQLTLQWDNFNWEMAQIIQLRDIVTWAPNLTRLHQGRIWGTWEGPKPILQSLTELHCWVLDDSTVISILRSCPSLEIVDIKNVRSGDNAADGPFLSHPVLLELVDQNPRLWLSLREFLIRPTQLTKVSVLKLTEKCPQLTRIGDLECWDVSTEEIQELNHTLYHSKSQCRLVVLSFPPPPKF